MAKFQFGDEVTVRGKVRHSYEDERVGVVFDSDEVGALVHFFDLSEIATHTPKPREFKSGDPVRKHTMPNVKLSIIAVDGVWAWVRDAAGWNFTCPQRELRHEDEVSK